MSGFDELQGVSIQQIRMFLAAAKYENFTKAAEEAYMTEASVSRNISKFELSLGLVLFVRHKKRVRLTSAGKALYERLLRIERELEGALEAARVAQRNQLSRLVIADQNATDMEAYLLPITKAFRERFPDVELAIDRDLPFAIRDNLLVGKYDAAFSISYALDDLLPDDIVVESLTESDPCVILADTHALYGKEQITLDDLRKEPLVAMRDGLYRYYWRFAHDVCQEFGLRDDNALFVTNEHSLSITLKQGRHIAIMDRMFAGINKGDIRYIPLEGGRVKSGLSLVFSRQNENPLLLEFRKTCRDYFLT